MKTTNKQGKDAMTNTSEATAQELAEYERLFAWRARWGALASKPEPGRLQSRLERIERRAIHCNHQIRALMRSYDDRVAKLAHAEAPGS